MMAAAPSGRAIEILLVDDSAADVDLTLDALKGSYAHSHVSVARDGRDASDFLRQTGSFAAAPRPDLVVLDLNLPKKSGFEVLSEIKSDARLCQIPVVVLTTSDSARDVAEAYRRQANCFITKPFEFAEYVQAIRGLDTFWLSIATLPP